MTTLRQKRSVGGASKMEVCEESIDQLRGGIVSWQENQCLFQARIRREWNDLSHVTTK